jgi:hypothetical protein
MMGLPKKHERPTASQWRTEMNSLTNAARTLTRSIFIAAGVAALALAAAQSAGAEEKKPYSPDVAANVQQSLCEVAGGEASVTSFRTPGQGLTGVHVRCIGGSLSGWGCNHYQDKSDCSTPLVRPEEPPAVEPVGGVETEPDPAVPTTDVADEVVAPTEGAEQPVVEEPVVEEPVVEEPVVEGGIDDESVAEETVDGGAVDDAGQDLLTNPALDETTAPTEGEPVADAGDPAADTGATNEGVIADQVVSDQNGGIVFLVEDDEQA